MLVVKQLINFAKYKHKETCLTVCTLTTKTDVHNDHDDDGS